MNLSLFQAPNGLRVTFSSKTSGYVAGRRWKYEDGIISIQSTRSNKWISQNLNFTQYHEAVSDAINARYSEVISARRLELGVA